MKADKCTQRQVADASGFGSNVSGDRGFLLPAALGFGVGGSASAIYLLLGGSYFFSIPKWASIAFFPGFCAGYAASDCGLSTDICLVLGVLGVALAYGVVAGFLGLMFSRS